MNKDLISHEYILSLGDIVTLEGVQEEIRLLADSMSSHKALADKIGISEQYLCDILKHKRLPGKKVLAFLKLEHLHTYREIK